MPQPEPESVRQTARPGRAFAFLFIGLIFFVLMDSIGKALAAQMGTPLISFARHAIHAALMVLIFGPTMGSAILQTNQPWMQIIRGLSLAGFTLSFFSALAYLPQAEATAIAFITPFFVMLLAGPVLGERVTRWRWMGAAGGFLGMLLILRPGADLSPTGVVFALVTVACSIVFQLLTRKLSASPGEGTAATVLITALVGTAVSVLTLPLMPVWGGWPDSITPMMSAQLIAIGVCGLVCQMCLVKAYYWSSASFIAPLTFLQIVWAAIAGWVFFGDLPDTLGGLGMAIICVSGIGSMMADTRQATPAKQS
ncbi:MAG: DMT family transporter [Betaproteobacteria bacterium]